MIDIFVLLMIHGVAAHRKSVEGLLRKKLREGCITEELLEHAYQNHPKVISVSRGYLFKLKRLLKFYPGAGLDLSDGL